jgi:hypothetical protein
VRAACVDDTGEESRRGTRPAPVTRFGARS